MIIKYFTKEIIKNSFNELLNNIDIDKITVSRIIEKAKISRQTFYYHFKDIYDLQEWIIKMGFEEVFKESIKCKTYKESLRCFFKYINEEKTFFNKVLESSERKFIEKIIYINIREYIYIYRKHMKLEDLWSRKNYEFNIDFYTCAITGMCIRFISDNNNYISTEQIVDKTHDLFQAQAYDNTYKNS